MGNNYLVFVGFLQVHEMCFSPLVSSRWYSKNHDTARRLLHRNMFCQIILFSVSYRHTFSIIIRHRWYKKNHDSESRQHKNMTCQSFFSNSYRHTFSIKNRHTPFLFGTNQSNRLTCGNTHTSMLFS